MNIEKEKVSPGQPDKEFRIILFFNSKRIPFFALRDMLDTQAQATEAPLCNLQDLKDLLLTYWSQKSQHTCFESMPRCQKGRGFNVIANINLKMIHC